jgi:hypothetical protein
VQPCLHSDRCQCYPTVEAVLPLLGQDPLTGVEAALTLPRRRLRAHCYSARLSLLAAGHHYLRARRRDGITRRLPARRAQ